MNIHQNIKNLLQDIQKICDKRGRNPNDVKLVGVSKNKSVDDILKAIDSGLNLFGENYVQEFLTKYEALKNKKISWHFIGHLQSNKVKDIIGKVDVIHSLDSLNLALEINKQAQKNNLVQHCFLQIHLSGESTKFGMNLKEVESFFDQISDLKNIKICGLMTLPHYDSDTEKVRPYFVKLREIRDSLNTKKSANLQFLSMGMSNDYQTALEEGATHIRVGTLIFGARD